MSDDTGAASNNREIFDFDDVVARHMSGDLEYAEKQYRKILGQEPQHLGALQMLGVINAQTGKPEQALKLLQKALVLAPDSSDVYNNLANVYMLLQQHEDAIKSYVASFQSDQNQFEPLLNLCLVLWQLGRTDEADGYWQKLMSLHLETPAQYLGVAERLSSSNRDAEAIIVLNKVLDIEPEYLDAINALGHLFFKDKKYEEAIANWDKAIHLNPSFPDPYVNASTAMLALGEFKSALGYCEKVLAIDEKILNAQLNIASCLTLLNRPDEAYPHCQIALGINVRSVDAQCVTSGVLLALGRFDEALACCDSARLIKPDDPKALYSTGHAMQRMCRDLEAVEWFDRALMIEPQNLEYRYNRSLSFLRLGKYVQGFGDYELRLGVVAISRKIPSYPWPRLKNLAEARGKRVLVFHEQGLGDALQFVRYVFLLSKMAAAVTLTVQPAIGPFLAESAGAENVLYSGESLTATAYDYQCSLMSIAHVFGTTVETIPAKTPYLHANSQKKVKWRSKVRRDKNLIVGLAWSGNPQHHDDHNRSIKLEDLAPLLAMDNICFVSLQKEVRLTDEKFFSSGIIQDFASDLEDFSDTAALVANVDLVIAVDTSVAHLAGAMGRPLWLMLPFSADWRWFSNREDSPWYPTARLFRQQSPKNWMPVVHSLMKALEKYNSNFNWLQKIFRTWRLSIK